MGRSTGSSLAAILGLSGNACDNRGRGARADHAERFYPRAPIHRIVMTHLQARPTEFAGITFRSKSEAMFAAALQKCGHRRDWIYEPEFLSTGDWVVDFALPVVTYNKFFHWQAIEYKPTRPTDTYLRELASRFSEIGRYQPIFAWCVWIDWYALKDNRFDWGALRWVCDQWQEERGGSYSTTPQAMPPFHGAYPQEFKEIASMRFDLVSS